MSKKRYENWGMGMIWDNEYFEEKYEDRAQQLSHKEITDRLNEQEDKLKRIKNMVDCNVYHDDLKDIILEIRCILKE